MKIEVGKAYRDNQGNRAIVDFSDGPLYYPYHVQGRGFYNESGMPANTWMNKQLVAEWESPDKPNPDGWIEWRGGECPVDEDAEVEVRLRDGAKGKDSASFIRWPLYAPNVAGSAGDVVAYRLAQPAKELPVTMEEDKHAHYFHDVSHLDKIDVYRVIDMFKVTHPALAHAAKKILCAGVRGAKDQAQDVQEAIDSLVRWQAMQAEDSRA